MSSATDTACTPLGTSAIGGPEQQTPDRAAAINRRIALAKTARGLSRHTSFRRKEVKAFPASNPGWDILVELYRVHCAGTRLSVTDIGSATDIPPATVVRWIGVLMDEEFVIRQADAHDRRRVWISLSRRGVVQVERMLDDLLMHLTSAFGSLLAL